MDLIQHIQARLTMEELSKPPPVQLHLSRENSMWAIDPHVMARSAEASVYDLGEPIDVSAGLRHCTQLDANDERPSRLQSTREAPRSHASDR